MENSKFEDRKNRSPPPLTWDGVLREFYKEKGGQSDTQNLSFMCKDIFKSNTNNKETDKNGND